MDVRLIFIGVYATISISQIILKSFRTIFQTVLVLSSLLLRRSSKDSSEYFLLAACWAGVAASMCCQQSVPTAVAQMVAPLGFAVQETHRRCQIREIAAWSVGARLAAVEGGQLVLSNLKNSESVMPILSNDSFFIVDRGISRQRQIQKEHVEYMQAQLPKWPVLTTILVSLNILSAGIFLFGMSASLYIFAAGLLFMGVSTTRTSAVVSDFELGSGAAAPLTDKKPVELVAFLCVACIALVFEDRITLVRKFQTLGFQLAACAALHYRKPQMFYACALITVF
jgi:hypothetical protein